MTFSLYIVLLKFLSFPKFFARAIPDPDLSRARDRVHDRRARVSYGVATSGENATSEHNGRR